MSKFILCILCMILCIGCATAPEPSRWTPEQLATNRIGTPIEKFMQAWGGEVSLPQVAGPDILVVTYEAEYQRTKFIFVGGKLNRSVHQKTAAGYALDDQAAAMQAQGMLNMGGAFQQLSRGTNAPEGVIQPSYPVYTPPQQINVNICQPTEPCYYGQ